jgi:hypothetical protein
MAYVMAAWTEAVWFQMSATMDNGSVAMVVRQYGVNRYWMHNSRMYWSLKTQDESLSSHDSVREVFMSNAESSRAAAGRDLTMVACVRRFA